MGLAHKMPGGGGDFRNGRRAMIMTRMMGALGKVERSRQEEHLA